MRATAGPAIRACAVVLALALVGACDDGGGDEVTPPTATTGSGSASSATTTTRAPAVDPAQDVLDAYAAAKAAVGPAFDPPDPQNPALLATHTGDALRNLQTAIESLAAQGLGGRNTFESYPRDVVVEGDVATLVDCFVDRTVLYDLETGQQQGPEGETIRLVEVRMERVDGNWLLAASDRIGDGCEPG